MKKISFNKKKFDKNLVNSVNEVLKSGWLTHGKYTRLFEKEFAKFSEAKYAVTLSSCTAALHLSCIACDFKKGDEVIVPSMTHVATAHAVEYTGATVVFSDVDQLTGNVTLENIKQKVTKQTKGVILVHMAGLACEMTKILDFCKKKKIKIIEDCAHALGSVYKNKYAGNFGIAGCFSFYPTKQITTGEGGMLITNNLNFFNKIKKLKAFGIDKDIDKRKRQGSYDVLMLGFNYRMTDFQAAMGYNQILKYKSNLSYRKKIASIFYELLSKNKKIKIPKFDINSSYFIFQIFIEKFTKLKILKYFKKNNIGVSVHYAKPLPLMSYYKNKYKTNLMDYKNAKIYADTNISLPISENLSIKEVHFICKKLNEVIN